jgi:hypothetical protein
VDWNSDGLPDLVIGEGGDLSDAKVRVYLNTGSAAAPSFADYFYAQANGADLVLESSGCMGLFPRVVYWDADPRKDLLIGTALGNVRIYLNTGSEMEPSFDGGTNLTVGPPAEKVDIDVGSRATPSLVDWNNDGKRDLVAGGLDGRIHLFLNDGLDTAPDYTSETFAQTTTGYLVVSYVRSSPVVQDFDDDGKKDILTGNTEGQLLLYSNASSDADPLFGDYQAITADGVPIDLPNAPRSRPSVCDWTGDGLLDVLIGAGDGKVHLYQGRLPGTPVADTPRPQVRLLPPYPNPFNPQVSIGFALAQDSHVRLSVLSVSGRRVCVLLDTVLPAGPSSVHWSGQDAGGRPVASGGYLIQLEAAGVSATQKVVLSR